MALSTNDPWVTINPPVAIFTGANERQTFYVQHGALPGADVSDSFSVSVAYVKSRGMEEDRLLEWQLVAQAALGRREVRVGDVDAWVRFVPAAVLMGTLGVAALVMYLSIYLYLCVYHCYLVNLRWLNTPAWAQRRSRRRGQRDSFNVCFPSLLNRVATFMAKS